MNNSQTVSEFRKEFVALHPQHQSDANDLYDLMNDEIESGESPENERYIFIASCNDLLN